MEKVGRERVNWKSMATKAADADNAGKLEESGAVSVEKSPDENSPTSRLLALSPQVTYNSKFKSSKNVKSQDCIVHAAQHSVGNALQHWLIKCYGMCLCHL